MATMTEQVEELILHAQREADRTGKRQRVEAVRSEREGRWYYMVRGTARWPNSLKRQVS